MLYLPKEIILEVYQYISMKDVVKLCSTNDRFDLFQLSNYEKYLCLEQDVPELACRLNKINIVRMLIAKKIDLNTTNTYKNTMLDTSCKFGNIEIVKLLIKNGGTVGSNSSMNGLHYACINQYYDITKLLLEQVCIDACSINAVDKDKRSPLYFAVKGNNYKLTKLLIDFGAWVDQPSKYFVPIEYAVSNENKKITKLLLKKGAKVQNNGLHNLSRRDYSALPRAKDTEMIKILCEFGGDLNFQYRSGVYLIHKATAFDNLVLLEFLLENGVNVNIQCTRGYTSLHIAVNFKKIECIKLLLKYNADKTLLNSNGQSVMDTKDPEILELLQ